ncbi:glycosyltransferase [Clostridium sp. AL.422]|uniref:glycosyltransferase n=1 Tax=Clostridium TaxID=1485 RepID=UPI00293DD886|nr:MULTISPECIES: glycosyltransferase [unclassified Clostridium]MDV4150391.1 glycosyltransferase [Clostridium sp. AL.422]
MNKILYISLVDWFWIKQRPHHFVEFLSKDNKVVYFCMQAWKRNPNTVVLNDSSKRETSKSIIDKGTLSIFRKKVIPFHRKYKFIENINDKLLSKRIEKLEDKNNFDIIIFTHPMQLKYFPEKLLKNKTIVYDCMDNYEEFNYYDRKELLVYESKLYDISGKIVCSSDKLKNKLYNKYSHKKAIKVINNGVDIKTFDINKVGKSTVIDGDKMNKIAYIGAISEWFDFDLIRNVSLRNPTIYFYIIGPIEKGVDIEKISNLKNVEIVGSIPYDEVPKVLASIDIAIMPFKLNELIKSVNPVKIYEYLSMGKKVLSIRYDETEKFSNYIELYKNEVEFEEKLKKLLKEECSIDYKIDYAKKNSWSKRVDEFYEYITT